MEIRRFRNGRVERRLYTKSNSSFMLFREGAEWQLIKTQFPGEVIDLDWHL